jgi:Flp pilus assembly pilin Flp
MNKFIFSAKRFIRDEEGVVTIEYVMLASAVVAAVVLVLTGAGAALSAKLLAIIAGIT